MLQSEATLTDGRKESIGTFNLEQHIHDGGLAKAKTERDPILGFDVPTECPGVPRDLLRPGRVSAGASAYDTAAKKLADLFRGASRSRVRRQRGDQAVGPA